MQDQIQLVPRDTRFSETEGIYYAIGAGDQRTWSRMGFQLTNADGTPFVNPQAGGVAELNNERPRHRGLVDEDKATGIHPAPTEFSEDEVKTLPMLRFFHYSHLPPPLQGTSQPFCALARRIVDTLPANAERTVALRKLLEGKDAAVRASLG